MIHQVLDRDIDFSFLYVFLSDILRHIHLGFVLLMKWQRCSGQPLAFVNHSQTASTFEDVLDTEDQDEDRNCGRCDDGSLIVEPIHDYA